MERLLCRPPPFQWRINKDECAPEIPSERVGWREESKSWGAAEVRKRASCFIFKLKFLAAAGENVNETPANDNEEWRGTSHLTGCPTHNAQVGS